MALIGNLNVDTKYSSMIEPNLYHDTIIIPGLTCTDKYMTGPAGQIAVHKLTGGAVAVGAPGVDFNDVNAADTLINMTFNNAFRKSTKIYNAQVNSVDFALGEEALADNIKACRDGRQESALACLVTEGSQGTLTATDSVGKLLEARKFVRDNKGKADFAIVSTTVYADLLKEVGIQGFADEAVRSGELLKRFGLNIFEGQFDASAAEYYNAAGTKVTGVDLSAVEIIVGNHEAFSVLDNVDMNRLIDSESFNGVKAQTEIVSAMTVNSPAQIVVA